MAKDKKRKKGSVAVLHKDDMPPGSKLVSEMEYFGSSAIYGRSGTGKTTLSATWPKPILYINILDDGTDSIADEEGVIVKNVSSSEEMTEVIHWAMARAKKKKLKFKTIVFDTLTQMQGILVREMHASKIEKDKRLKNKQPGDWGTMTKQDWGEIAGDMKALIQDARNLPLQSVFICQERIFNLGDEEDEDDTLQPEVGARLSPSVKDDLNASVSIIGHTFIRVKRTKKKDDNNKTYWDVKKQFCLHLGPNELYTTKVRKPKKVKAPDYIIDPTYEDIMAIVKEGVE
jgi:hypothetical protein